MRPRMRSSSPAPTSRLRPLQRNSIRLALLVLAAFYYLWLGNSASLFLFNTCLLAAVAALALNFLMGTAGQPSLGTTAFLGVGGFFTVALMHQGLPYVAALLAAAALAGVGGLLVGLPSLRLSGLYLALATLGAYFIMNYFGQQYQDSAAGPAGFVVQPFFATSSPMNQQRYWCLILLAFVGAVAVVIEQLSSGRAGRALRMIREHEAAAPALGIPVRRYKVYAFVFYAVVTALAGGIGAEFIGNVSTDSFTLTITISYVAMVIIGGIDSVTGAIIGAFVITLLPTFVSNETTSLVGSSFAVSYGSSISEGLYGLAIVVIVSVARGGLAGLGSTLYGLLRRVAPSRRRAVPGYGAPPLAGELGDGDSMPL